MSFQIVLAGLDPAINFTATKIRVFHFVAGSEVAMPIIGLRGRS